jgi:hypothetical protein
MFICTRRPNGNRNAPTAADIKLNVYWLKNFIGGQKGDSSNCRPSERKYIEVS